MSKIIMLAIAGGAYLLGAKAGTERYEQITGQVARLWNDLRVQEQTAKATDRVKQTAAKVTDSDDEVTPSQFGQTPNSSSDSQPGGRSTAESR